MYVAATRSVESLEFVSITGRGLIVGVVLDTGEAVELLKRSLDMAQQSGSPVTAADITFSRYSYVAETAGEAHRDARDALNCTLVVNNWRTEFPVGSEVYQRLDEYRRTRTKFAPT